jgi:hypothetical protein
MAEKAEGDTTPEAQKRRAETIPQFFQIGLRPEGPLCELLKFWEVTKGTDFSFRQAGSAGENLGPKARA